MMCRKCGSTVLDPREHCSGCGAWAGGWFEMTWLAATALGPVLWLAGYMAVLGLSG